MTRLDDGTMKISNSELKTFLTCRRKWMLTYFMKLGPKDTFFKKAPEEGTLLHGALERFYRAGGIHGEGDTEALAYEWLDEQRAKHLEQWPEQEKEIMGSHFTAHAMFESYLHWLHETGADLDIGNVRAEQTITMEGPEGVLLSGQLDLLAEHLGTGDQVILDFKAVQSIDTFIKNVPLQTQGKFYGILIRNAYQKPVRIAYRLVKRNKRTAKVKGPQEEQYLLPFNDGMLDVYWQQLNGVIHEMLRTEDLLNNGKSHQAVCYPTPSSECSWSCPFFSVCPMLDDPHTDSEWMLNEAFTVVDPYAYRSADGKSADDQEVN